MQDRDLMFTSLAYGEQTDTAPSDGDDVVWESAESFEEMLTLPLRMVESLIEAVV